MFAIFLSILVGYFLGSVPFGFLAARARGLDIRQHGSGNIGATNVWRVCGWRVGLPVFLLDALKGAAAVLLAGVFARRWPSEFAPILGGIACIVGHSFPVWLGWKGGKGVATSLGVLIALTPLASLVLFVVWGVVFKMSRYVSLASVVVALTFPLLVGLGTGLRWRFFAYGWPTFGFALFASGLVLLRHRSNIQRLLAGTENRFGAKKEAQ